MSSTNENILAHSNQADQPKQSVGNATYLGALELGQEIIQPHTDFLMLNWRDRVNAYESIHLERKFIVKHVKKNIVIRRIK